jgi:serine protease Do
VRTVISQIKDKGVVTRGWLGVQIQPVTGDIAETLGMKASEGALVSEPQSESPAAKAGIIAGDVITGVNGKAIKDAHELAKEIGAMSPGTSVNLSVWRKGEEKTMSIALGELPSEHAARAASPDTAATDAPKLGLMLAPASEVAGSSSEGVVVMQIDPNGLASEHGLKTGDVILDVGGKKVATPADVRNAVVDAHKNGKRTVLMRLKSNGTTKFVAIAHA